jgi:hypothetical protein
MLVSLNGFADMAGAGFSPRRSSAAETGPGHGHFLSILKIKSQTVSTPSRIDRQGKKHYIAPG